MTHVLECGAWRGYDKILMAIGLGVGKDASENMYQLRDIVLKVEEQFSGSCGVCTHIIIHYF